MGQDEDKQWRLDGDCYQSDSSFNESATSVCSNSSDMQTFFGIYLPPDVGCSSKPMQNVVTDKVEALRFVKLNKGARFRQFSSELEAVEFSRSGGEVISVESPSCNNERSIYKEPKTQELLRFRKAIENHDLNTVKRLINENPRYLVGSGDTPTILQEGFRYNALHVSARTYSSEVCSHILSVISDTNFFARLYGPNINLQERRNMLVDLYLNMPDKGFNETPLHFASKLGAVEVVKILTSYSECDKLRRNKSNFTASDIVCSRAPESMVNNKKEILKWLDTQYYIPVLRSADNSLPPVIGEPFTNANPPIIVEHNCVLTPPLEVRAVAGPMSEEKARVFRKKWKTPPRVSDSPHLKFRPELSDPEKGLERVGRILANEFCVEWKEYWPFLNSFLDLSSLEGLSSLENYLKERFERVCDFQGSYNNNSYKHNSKNCFSETNSKHPLVRDLAEEFSKMSLNEMPRASGRAEEKNNIPSFSGDCPELTMNGNPLDLRNNSIKQHSSHQHDSHELTKSLHLRIATMENSCQVYASRIGSSIILGMKNNVFSEVTRFQEFLASSITDDRLTGIDFSKCHYRLAALICNKITSFTEDQRSIVANLNELTNSVDHFEFKGELLPTGNINSATLCIIQFVNDILNSHSTVNAEYLLNDSKNQTDLLWNVADSCLCVLPLSTKKSRNKYVPRLLFNDDCEGDETHPSNIINNERLSAENHNLSLNTNAADSEDEYSDDEYFTAENSLVLSSDEDAHMSQTETGPDIYLTGHEPTKIDKAVLDALENISIPLNNFPHITMWKHACMDHSKKKPKEKWPTPKVQRTFPRSYFNSC